MLRPQVLDAGEGVRGVKAEKIPGSGEGLLHSALLVSQAQAPPGSQPAPSLLSLSLSLPGMEAQGCGSSPAPQRKAGLAQNPGCKGPHHASTEVRTSRGDGDASWRRRELFKEVPVVSGGQQPLHASAPVDESEVWSGPSGALGALSQVVCVAGRPGRQRNL